MIKNRGFSQCSANYKISILGLLYIAVILLAPAKEQENYNR